VDKIAIIVQGRKALANREHAPLFIKKEKLVQEAVILREKIAAEKTPAAQALEMTNKVFGKIIRINKQIQAKQAFVEFI